jgi:hypothetical protein
VPAMLLELAPSLYLLSFLLFALVSLDGAYFYAPQVSYCGCGSPYFKLFVM